MGIFTLHNDTEIDRQIKTDLDIICNEILSAVRPISILLAGTFGNGEGSVLIQETKIMPVADYDLLIIVEKNHLLTKKELDDLKTRITARCQSGEIRYSILKGCKIDLFQSSAEDFQSNAHLSIYNMIHNGSIVLYGKDIRPTVTIDLTRMAPSACYFSLLRSITSFLKNFPETEREKSEYSKEDRFSLIFYLCKIYLHMGTQLTLCQNLYHPSCRKRGKRLNENWLRCYSELAMNNPHLPEKIMRFSELTLFPDDIMRGSLDPIAIWFEARQDFENVMKYCLKTTGATSTDSWEVLSEQMYHFLKANYFHYYIEHYLENRYHIRFTPITSIVNVYIQFRIAHNYRIKSHVGIQGIHLYTICPLFKLYAISPLLLFSVQNDGNIDRALFSAFQKEFATLFPRMDTPSWENNMNNWMLAKDMFFKALNIARKVM